MLCQNWDTQFAKMCLRAYADSEGPDQSAHPWSDQGLRCPLTESLSHYKIYQWRANARMRLCACGNESESVHFAHAGRHLFAWRGLMNIESKYDDRLLICHLQRLECLCMWTSRLFWVSILSAYSPLYLEVSYTGTYLNTVVGSSTFLLPHGPSVKKQSVEPFKSIQKYLKILTFNLLDFDIFNYTYASIMCAAFSFF